MKPYIHGKSNQLELISEYKHVRKDAYTFRERMMFLNQTSNILIIDDSKLMTKLNFDIKSDWVYNKYDSMNDKLAQNNFNDLNYMAGLFDAEGTVNINMRNNKTGNTDRFIPQILFTNTNKIIAENYYSAIRNNLIGCHVTSRIPKERNRIRWDLMVSGLSRTKKVCDLLICKTKIKHKQLELMLSYVSERLSDQKSINTTGYNAKMAIQSLRK
jgi:hypothetical protein